MYSALQAADLVFGAPVGGFYEISTLGIDPNLIDNMGWYDVIGQGPSTFAESYSLDLGPNVGYGGTGWISGNDVSAYVRDNCGDDRAGTCINYVFFNRSIPEPTTLALMGLALAGLGYQRRKAA